jgi:hypothetical protein
VAVLAAASVVALASTLGWVTALGRVVGTLVIFQVGAIHFMIHSSLHGDTEMHTIEDLPTDFTLAAVA